MSEKWAHFEDASEARGYTQISNVVMRHPGLSMPAKYLYGLLKSYAWQDPTTHPGLKRMCGDANASDKTLGKYLKELQDFGLIEVKRRGQGKTNLYVFKALSSGLDSDTGSDQEPDTGSDQEPDTGSGNEDSVNEDSSTNSRKGASGDALADVMKNPGKYFSDLLATAGKEPTDRERERCFVHMKQLISKQGATRVEMEKIASSGFQAHMNGYEWWPKDLLNKLRQNNVTPLRRHRPETERMASTAGYREFS